MGRRLLPVCLNSLPSTSSSSLAARSFPSPPHALKAVSRAPLSHTHTTLDTQQFRGSLLPLRKGEKDNRRVTLTWMALGCDSEVFRGANGCGCFSSLSSAGCHALEMNETFIGHGIFGEFHVTCSHARFCFPWHLSFLHISFVLLPPFTWLSESVGCDTMHDRQPGTYIFFTTVRCRE